MTATKRRTIDECIEALNESRADDYSAQIETHFREAESSETVEDFDANLDHAAAAARMFIAACHSAKSKAPPADRGVTHEFKGDEP